MGPAATGPHTAATLHTLLSVHKKNISLAVGTEHAGNEPSDRIGPADRVAEPGAYNPGKK